ncbi:MAG: hypothetical protein AAF678_00210 [Pseudomonadota bacterium]
MNKDQLIREMREQAGSWQAIALVYVGLIAVMVMTGMAITG